MKKLAIILIGLFTILVMDPVLAKTRYCGQQDDPTTCTSSEPESSDTIAKGNDDNWGGLSGLISDGTPGDKDSLEILQYTLSSTEQSLAQGAQNEVLDAFDSVLNRYHTSLTDVQSKMDNLNDVLANAKQLYILTSGAISNCVEEGSDYCYASAKEAITMDSTMSAAEAALDLVEYRCSNYQAGKVNPILDKNQFISELEDDIDELNEKYADQKNKVCSVVHKFYTLKTMLEQLQAIRDDGIQVVDFYRKKGHSFGGYTRHVTMSADLRFYPDLQGTYDSKEINPNFSLDNDNSYFKYSDNDKKPLGSLLNRDSTDNEDSLCDRLLWFKLSSKIKFQFIFDIEDASSGEASLGLCARFHASSSTYEMTFGTVDVPLPFGYLAAVSAMKDEGKQELVGEIGDALEGLFGFDDKLSDLSDKAESAHPPTQEDQQ